MAPGVVTLQNIRDTVRQRADMVNSSFVTDAELNGYIAASLYELYDLLVQKFGDSYYAAGPYQFTTDGVLDQYDLPDGTSTYKLPDGTTTAPAFYKLTGVDLKISGDSWITLRPFVFAERNRWSIPNSQTAYGVTNLRYRVLGSHLWFTPRPSGGQTLRIWYTPRLAAPTADGDTIDGVSGWEEYVVADACIKALSKEESDPSVFMAQKQALLQRIEAAAENRDAGSPQTVSDVYGSGTWWPGTGGFSSI